MKHSSTNRFHDKVPRVKEKAREDMGVALLHVTFRASLVLTIMIIALIGLWSAASAVGVTVVEGGVFELIRGWFSAWGGG